jgi:hypothetical protein
VSPKQRLLQQKPLAEKIAALMGSETFQIAADVTVLQFAEIMSEFAPNAGDAAAAKYRLEGAKAFLSILQNIATQPTQPTQNRTGQLDHNV